MTGAFSFAQTFLNVASIGTLVVILVLTSGNIRKHGGMEFSLMVASLIVWASGSFFEGISDNLEALVFWRNFTQLGIFLSPLAINMFAGAYTDDNNRPGRVFMRLALAVQVTALALIFTDSIHHVMRVQTAMIVSDTGISLSVRQTIAGKIFVSFNFFLAAMAEVRLFAFLFKIPRKNRLQVFAIVVGTAIPVTAGLLMHSLTECFAIQVPISVLFIPASVTAYWGIRRHGLIAVAPVAREIVLNVIDDGVLVFSEDGLIIEANRSAKLFLEKAFPDAFGNPDCIRSGASPEFRMAIGSHEKTFLEYAILSGNKPGQYEITVYPLLAGMSFTGCLAIIRDATERFRQDTLLRLKAETDGLTGTLNRETFVARVEASLAEFGEADSKSSFLVVDIDYFKAINDTMGHPEGDRILSAFARAMFGLLEPQDIFGRVGGDEFGIFMTRPDEEALRSAARALVSGIGIADFGTVGKPVRLSISIGVVLTDARHAESFELLFAKADKALYRAKDKGRNTTFFFDTPAL